MSAFTLLLLSSGLNLGFRVLFHRFNFDLRWIRNYLLGYLKDSYVAAYSVDSDIIFAVIHLQLYAWWRIDGELCTWQGIVTKKHIVSQLCLDIKQYTSTSPFRRSWKSRCGNCRSSQLTNSVLVRIKCRDPECCNWQTSKTRTSRCTKMLIKPSDPSGRSLSRFL